MRFAPGAALGVVVAALGACTTGANPTDRADTGRVPSDTSVGETGTTPGTTPTLPTGWAALAPLLAPLQEHSVVALLGEVVVLGGYNDARQIVDRVEAYDPSTDSWRALASLPEPSHHVNAAVVGDRIYVLGVLQGGFLESAVLWIYDPATDAWTTGARPPASHVAGASVVGIDGTDIHVIGGLQSVRAVALHSVYDTVSDRWDTLPDSPRDRDHAAGGTVGGRLLAVAGREVSIASSVDAVDRYDLATGTWSTGAPIPTARSGVGHAFDTLGHLHVVGGEGNAAINSGVFPQHEVYDPTVDGWTELPPMAQPRHGMGAVFVDGVLYVPGGAPVQGFGAVDTFDQFRPE